MMSRLPENDAYWQTLTDRLVTDAVDRLSSYRSAGRRWWQRPARFFLPLSLGAAAAVIAALIWLPDIADESVEDLSATSLYGFAPGDSLGAAFVTSAAPPTLETLMITPTSERTQ